MSLCTLSHHEIGDSVNHTNRVLWVKTAELRWFRKIPVAIWRIPLYNRLSNRKNFLRI